MNTENQQTENTPKPLKPVQTEFADVDRYHLAPGVFQIMGGKRKPEPLELRLDLPNGFLEITAPRPLRPFDAVLLCVILCKAAQDKKIISPDTENPVGKELRTQLELIEAAVTEKCLAYHTSARRLIEDMGNTWHGTITLAQIKESLKRLFSTTFILERYKDGKTVTHMFRLMSNVKLEKTRDVTIAFGINPVLAAALLTPGHYARIDMEILRNLEQAQQLMFIGLSNAIDPGKKRSFTPQELRELLYGPINDKIPANTLVKQTSRAKATAAALIEKLGDKGWQLEDHKTAIWIKRPFYPGQKSHKKGKKKKAQASSS